LVGILTEMKREALPRDETLRMASHRDCKLRLAKNSDYINGIDWGAEVKCP
jgi:hypothetical protein